MALGRLHLSGLRVVAQPVGMHDSNVWMLVQHLCRLQKLGLGNPEVVARTVGHVLPATSPQAVEVVADKPFIRFVGQDAHLVRMLLLVLSADGEGVVCRTVFADDDFYGQAALLHEDAVERAGDSVLLVVGADDDGY